MTDTTDLLEGIGGEAAARLDDAVDLRRRIHRHPELGLDLPVTQATVLEALDGLPVTTTTGTATSSVIAVLDGDEPGPTVLLRGDMDALPMPEDTDLDFASEVDGAMHACGHDAHVAMLAGAASLLASRRGSLAGRVVFMFQPGEEGFGGAKVMLDEGLLDVAADGAEPVSLGFAIHQSPTLPSGLIASRGQAILAATDEFEITVQGRGGHASMPHHAGDPIPAAAAMISAIQTMVTRRVDVFDPAVVTVASMHGGTTTNVIPETATFAGTIRTVSPSTRALVVGEIRRVVEGVAAAHGVGVEVESTPGYPVTVNDPASAAFALDTAARLAGERAAFELPTPIMGGEDWSYVLEQVPGAMAFLGTRPDGIKPEDVAPNHSNRMVIDEGAMAAGIALYSGVALRHLANA